VCDPPATVPSLQLFSPCLPRAKLTGERFLQTRVVNAVVNALRNSRARCVPCLHSRRELHKATTFPCYVGAALMNPHFFYSLHIGGGRHFDCDKDRENKHRALYFRARLFPTAAIHPISDVAAGQRRPKPVWQETPRLRTPVAACTFAAMKASEDEAPWGERLTNVTRHEPTPTPENPE